MLRYIAPYAALSYIISFLITGHKSIYPPQTLGIRKSPSISVKIGKEIDKIEPSIRVRRKSLINIILTISRKLVERFKKR